MPEIGTTAGAASVDASSEPLTPAVISESRAAGLSDCLSVLSGHIAHVVSTIDAREVRVTEVMLHDAADEDPRRLRDAIVLAVGLEPGSDALEHVLALAVECDAAAVVVKAYGSSVEAIRSAGARHQVSVLVARDNADWTTIATLARTAVLGASTDAISGARLGDIFAFANAAASITGGATSIVDPVGRVLGYSTLSEQPIDELRRLTTLALRELEPPGEDDDFKRIYAASQALVVPTSSGADRLAMAIRAGGELLGSVWVVDPGQDRRAAALTALDRLAPVAGLHMLHTRTSADFAARRASDLMRTLLTDPDHAPAAAAEMGLSVHQSYAVAAFSVAPADEAGPHVLREQQQLLHLVSTTCAAHFAVTSGAMVDSIVYALLPGGSASSRAAQRQVAADICASAQAITVRPVIVGIGQPVGDLAEIPRSRFQADSAMEYRMSIEGLEDVRANQAVALFEDYRVQVRLRAVADLMTAHDYHRDETVEAIKSHDDLHGTEYLPTLRAYLAANGSVSKVGEVLHVHKNTVRYRISRLTDVFGLEFGDADTWLWLRLVMKSTEHDA